MDKAIIKGRFTKDDLQISMETWVSATSNTVVIDFTANKNCRLKLNLWAAQGNTSVNDAGKTSNIFWVTRSFQNTPLLEWPCHISIAMKILNGTISHDKIVEVFPGKKLTIALVLYTSFDKKKLEGKCS